MRGYINIEERSFMADLLLNPDLYLMIAKY